MILNSYLVSKSMKKPNLFVVGFPKSGTSSLYYWLKQHPDVFMSRKKEPSFFSQDFDLVGQIKSKQEYEKLFLNAKEKIIGEASTSYSFSKEAPINIKKYEPNAKIVFIIRDFDEVLESLYIHRVHRTGDPIRDNFKSWFDVRFLNKQGKIGKNFYPFWNLLEPYKTITTYMNLFGKENVLLLGFKEMAKNPEGFFRKVCKFLKIGFCIVNFGVENKTFGPKSALIEKIGHFIRNYLSGDNWYKSLRFWEKNRKMSKPSYLRTEDKEYIDNLLLEDMKKIRKLMTK